MKDQERQRIKKSDNNDRLDDDLADLAAVVMAGDTEIAEFTQRLDSRRAATVESLIENEQKLADVQKRINDRLAKAYVLPDGRRVFKTEDGLRVFDEYGVELSTDIIDPDMIEDWRPRAGGHLIDLQDMCGLLDDRERKLNSLDKMDQMEERIAEGDVTQEDLQEMEKELEAITSPDILARVEGIEWTPPTMKGDFHAASAITPADMQIPASTLGQFAPG